MHPPVQDPALGSSLVRPAAPAPTPPTLSAEFLARADEIVARYPASKRSASLPLLHLWQETFGHIADAGICWIAERLGLQPINILELVTFYPMLRQKPAGRCQIKVCRTLSCALQGAYELCDHFKRRCNAPSSDAHGLAISPDGKYSVEFVECLASCHTAPVVMIQDDFHESVTPEKADALLKQYPV